MFGKIISYDGVVTSVQIWKTVPNVHYYTRAHRLARTLDAFEPLLSNSWPDNLVYCIALQAHTPPLCGCGNYCHKPVDCTTICKLYALDNVFQRNIWVGRVAACRSIPLNAHQSVLVPVRVGHGSTAGLLR